MYLCVGERELNPSVIKNFPIAVFDILKRSHHICPHLFRLVNFKLMQKLKSHRGLEGDFSLLARSAEKIERPQDWRPGGLVRGPGVILSCDDFG